MPSALKTKLEEAAREIVCREWSFGTVLSPQRLVQKFEHELAVMPGPIAEDRLTHAGGMWGVVFQHPPTPDSRYRLHSGRMQEAIVNFTPEQVRQMSIHELRKSCVGVIIEREVHEMLEFAQLSSQPGVPLFNPHHYSDDLVNIVNAVGTAILDHAD